VKLYSPAVVKQLMEKHKFHFQKGLGQNFLIDGNIVNKIVEAAEVTHEDVVVEIGAGIGTLTKALAARAARVIVIEIDRKLWPILGETLAGCDNVEIVFGNAMNTDFNNLVLEKTGGEHGPGGKTFKIVANLPYYITTPLIMHALESHFNIKTMVLMIQKEVAERMLAGPGTKDYGALTLAIQYYTDPEHVFRVPKKVFMPQPEVESSVVRFNVRGNPPVAVDDEKVFFRVVRAAFGQRRKTLSNSLSGISEQIEKKRIMDIMSDLGIDPGRRGETLNFGEFAAIANAVYRLEADIVASD